MKQILAVLLISWYSQSLVIGQQSKIIKIGELETVLKTKSDKIQIVNFWATWCAPCVKEMPNFEKTNLENPEVKVTLVSLDLLTDASPEKVYKFVERKKLQSAVVILDETDANSWIDKVDKRWSGSLPATLIINTKTGKREFKEGELKEGELEKLINLTKREL